MPKKIKGKHGGARKGAGRKPVGARAMTAAERQKRHRNKAALTLEKAHIIARLLPLGDIR